MATNRKFSVKFGGITDSHLNDTKMDIHYLNVFANQDASTLGFSQWSGGKVDSYSEIFPEYKELDGGEVLSPLIFNYTADVNFSVSAAEGLYASIQGATSESYSVYRREYDVYQRPANQMKGYFYGGNFYSDSDHKNLLTPSESVVYVDQDTMYWYQYNTSQKAYIITDRVKTYKGQWEPVFVKGHLNSFYDFNIKNGRSYQYILYASENSQSLLTNEEQEMSQAYANTTTGYKVWIPDSTRTGQGKIVDATEVSSVDYGSIVKTGTEFWTIAELEPVTLQESQKINSVKAAYQVNPEQIWAFKYSLETGSQTQNISRTDFQNLGKYLKIGYGESNYISGEVTALLGSEIIPYSKNSYVERLRSSRISPLSTNEKVAMLEQWRKLIGSKNPKLLRDIKGQSWIVQVASSSNTPKNLYYNQPDTITFQWKQVDSTDNLIIYMPIGTLPKEEEEKGSMVWESVF